jgi:hypothetical protein
MNTETLARAAARLPSSLCPRTFALYKPGIPFAGVGHRYAWTGSAPLTRRMCCTLCGQERP